MRLTQESRHGGGRPGLRPGRLFRLCLFVMLAGCAASPPETQHAETAGAEVRERRPIDFEEVIKTAKEKVFPALVFVKPIRESYGRGEKAREQVFGSGVIISPEGLVVTNDHVVDKAIEINCVLWNREQVSAKLIGQDKETDLALIKLAWDKEEPLPWARFTDSDDLTEGQFVMALGAPFGFTRSISLGIVSHTQRYIGFRTMYKYNVWLQTDAAINPGNSGGPLVDTRGRVVGINTLGIFGGSMGFSIPANEVQRIAARLQKDGKVVRAWTGIELQALKDFDSNTFTDSEDGVLVKGVEMNSPAQRAGLTSGDILLAVDGEQLHGTYVEQIPVIRWALADLPVGRPTKIAFRRAGEVRQAELTPVLKGQVEGEDFDCRRWNMTVKGITKHVNPTLYFYRKKGVFIRAVRYPGNAAAAGFRRHDIILKIGAEEIEGVEDVKRAYDVIIKDEKREKKVLIRLLRGGLAQLKVLDYTRDYEKED